MREGWETKRLGELCEIRTGKKDVNQGNPEGIYPFFTCAKTHTFSDVYSFDTEAILIAGNGDVGNVSYYDGKFEAYQRTYVLMDFENILPWYLYLVLDGLLKATVSDQKLGNTMPYIKKGMLTDFEVLLPPLPEQKRIVAILDEAFAGIATAVANTEKNLANARELFESYLNNVFIQKEEGWEEKKLGAVCIVERGSSPRPIKSFLTEASDGVNWVKIGDTKGINKYIHSTKQKITREGAERSRRVEPGDFILTNSMTYGKPYIMATTGYIHDGWFVLRLAEAIDTDFFYYLLASDLVQAQFGSLAAGAVVKNISSDLVKKAVLPIPPISEQRLVVKEIEKLATETQRLESFYQHKLTSLAELKQSLLHKAFSGALTAHPERALQEAVA